MFSRQILAKRSNHVFKRFLDVQSNKKVMPTDALEQDSYHPALAALHWIMGGSVLAAIGAVYYAQQQPKTPEGNKIRGDAMFWHKSFGLLVAVLLPFRIGLRLGTRIPPPVPMPTLQSHAAYATHLGLYAGMIFMGISGPLMGYYSGRGLPFFFTTIDTKPTKPEPETAKQLYIWHKNFGYYWAFLPLLHIGGAGVHFVQGQRIFGRMNPFLCGLRD